jgi:hypothetical protein
MGAIVQDLQQKAAAPEVNKAPLVEQAAGLREGDIVGKLEVPRIGISGVVLQGVENLL